MKIKPRFIFFLFIVLIFLVSCNVTRNLKPNEYLLVKNRFRINTFKISSDDLTGYLQQNPNKKLLGLFHVNIAFYNLGSKGKETKFKKWIRYKLGDPPVILDTNLSQISVKQMGLYLNNKGYYDSRIYDSVAYHRKKAIVHYFVKASVPYTLNSFSYLITDSVIASIVYKDSSKCLIKKGMNYDSYLLDEERNRLTSLINQHGYYRFTNNYISYRIDSALNNRQMNITLEITNPVIPSIQNLGMVEEISHKQYYIHRVEIYPDYDPLRTDPIRYDTLEVIYRSGRNRHDSNTYYFFYRHKLKIRPWTITQSIYLGNGALYNVLDVNQSYSQLASLKTFNFARIEFNETIDPLLPHLNLLDTKIFLARSPVHSLSVSTDGTNSAGAFGVQGNLIYQNKNIFRGAQLFRANLSASAQMQGSIGSTSNEVLFNTIEFGINTSLTLPQFLIPLRPELLPKYFKPRTIISLGYNFQLRSDYDRHISNISFGYQWEQKSFIHLLNPVEILLVKVNPDSSFTAKLNAETDKRLKNQYTDHLILGLKYTLTFRNQNVKKINNYYYIRSNFDIGGNLLYAIDNLVKAPKNENGHYTLFDIQYAQFVRPDFDFRFYHPLSKNTNLVVRFYGGIGIAYGNTKIIPFEKAFFAGGANDIRGWKLGTLGPGSYHNDTLVNSYDQTGDMQLQGNLEYRFPVYKNFKSAVFLDAGNVWLVHESPDYPGGLFKFDTFFRQVAMDAGIGFRLDFNIFIFRLDPAIPIFVPYYQENNHWYLSKIRLSDIVWNFGIGYPF